MSQNHLIEQQTITISADNANLSQSIFKDISWLFNHRMLDVSSGVFDRLIDENELLKIQSLEIDLGTLSFPFSVEEMATRYSKVLEEEVIKALKKLKDKSDLDEENKGIEGAHLEISFKNMLEEYLLYGTITRWLSGQGTRSLNTLYFLFLKENETKLKQVIINTYSKSYVRKRLIFNFSEDVIKSIIYLLEPNGSEFIFSYHSQLLIKQKEKKIVNSEESEFRKKLWLFVLDFLANSDPSYFNRKTFLKYNLNALAQHYNISFEKLLFYFSETLQSISVKSIKSHELIEIVSEISEDYFFETSSIISASKNEFSQINNDHNIQTHEDVYCFLVYGYLRHNRSNLTIQQLRNYFIEIANEEPEQILSLIRKYGEHPKFKKRIIEDLGELAIEKTITIIQPIGAKTIIDYVNFTTEFQSRKHLVNAESKSFRASIWEFVFTFLFSDRGSVFNTKVFLGNNIRAISNHYNLEFKHLLILLIQGIGEENSIQSTYTNLFYVLIEIFNEDNKDQENYKLKTFEDRKQVNSANTKSKEAIETNLNETDEHLYIENVILFWIEHGTLPWWAKNQKMSGEVLFSNFINDAPSRASAVLKIAMVSNKTAWGFWVKHTDLFFKTFPFIIDSKATRDFLNALLNIPIFNTWELAHSELKTLMIIAISDVCLKSNFLSFNLKSFIDAFFHHIKISVSINSYEQLIANLKNIKFNSELKELNTFLEQVPVNAATYDWITFTNSHFSLKDVSDLLDTFIDKSQQYEPLDRKELAQNILTYFILYQKLPDNIVVPAFFNLLNFINGITLFLYRKHPKLLIDVLENTKQSKEGRMKFYEILTAPNRNADADLQQLIFKYFQQDINTWINQQEHVFKSQSNSLDNILKKINSLQDHKLRIQIIRTSIAINSFRTYAASYYKHAEFIDLLSELTNGETVKVAQNFTRFFTLLVSDSFEREKLLIWMREFFFFKASSNAISIYNERELLREFIQFIYYQKQVSPNTFLIYKQKSIFASKVPTQYEAVLFHSFYVEINKLIHKDELKKTLQNNITNKESRAIKEILEKTDFNNNREELLSKKKKLEKLIRGEKIYLNNAGLILLHPYYALLFSRANLTIDGKFIDDEKKSRAALLIQYLVSGIEDAEEHGLLLNKIICGMSPMDVLIGNQQLTEDEKTMANGMIVAVMKQWDKMKNTSIDGFRGSFLMRNGYLLETDDAWQLRVEQKAHDVLLQTLPWSFSMIKFSWMEKPIIIEWI